MSALPALSKTYATRANIPFPDVSTAALVAKSQAWLLKAALMNQITTGTLSGTRHANSVWTCYYSCDGAVAGTPGDGVDRWGSTFDASKLVQASYTAAHSWIVLYNATSGLYLVIDLNNATTSSVRLELGLAAFTGGGVTGGGPTTTAPVPFASTTSAVNSTVSQWVGDAATGNSNWAHFTTTDDGRFHFEASRTGLGVFSNFTMVWTSTGGRVGDVTNWYTHASGGTTSRGVPVYTTLIASNGCVSRSPNNSAIVTLGGVRSAHYGGNAYPSAYGVDAISGDYLLLPLDLMSLAPQVAYRGTLDDLYFIGTAALGASVPSTAAQERVVVGDLLVPFMGTVPTV